MLTALAAEVRIQDRLDELKTTAAFLCKLDGHIGTTRLNRALRGLQDLENSDAIRLLTLTQRLVDLRDAFAPVPVSWENPTDIRWMLENLTASTEEIQQAVLQLFRERI
jgi:hypothetical protein